MLRALRAIDATDEAINESPLSETLAASVPDGMVLTEEERRGAFALLGGCSFQCEWGSPRSPWGIYWSERASGTAQDGSVVYVPDVAEVRDDTLADWMEVADSLRHPLLSARFADLAWEIGTHLKSQDQSRIAPVTSKIKQFATSAIDGYLRVIEERLLATEIQAWQLIQRALGLATHIKDPERIARAKAAMFAFHRDMVAAGQRHLWWKFDDLCW